MHTSRPGRALAGIIAVSVAVRVLAAVYHGDSIGDLPGIQDQVSYDALARRLLDTHSFSFPVEWWPATRAGEPTAHWSYLYTLFLAAAYAMFGGHPLAARLVQAVATGVLYPLLAWRIGRRLFGIPTGLVTAGMIGCYGYFVYYAGALMTESLYIAAILWALEVATRQARRPAARWPARARVRALIDAASPWFRLGIALGCAALLRQLVLLFLPFLYAWIAWARGRWSAGDVEEPPRRRPAVAGGLLVTTLVVVAMIAPWTIRNYLVFGRFVLLNTNAGYAFFWANHPAQRTDFVSILPAATYRNLIPAELRGLDEAALDQALLREGLRFVADDPLRYARLSLSRLKDYFEFWPSAESGPISNAARTLSFGVYLPFMLYGVLLSARRRPATVLPGQWPAVLLLWTFVAVYSAIHLLSWALIRYRLPVDAVLMPFGALGMVDLAERLFGSRVHTARRPSAAVVQV